MDNKKDNFTPAVIGDDPKKLVSTSLFEKDNFFIFIYKKTERIVSALYLTSSLFPDNEPIKWQLREVGVAVIARVLSLTVNPTSKSDTVFGIKSDFLRLLSLLDIASSAGFMSEMNFSILKKEMESITETFLLKVSPKEIKGVSGGKLDKDFFALSPHLFFAEGGQRLNHQPDLAVADGADPLQSKALHSWEDVGRLENFYKRQNKGQETTSPSFTTNVTVAHKKNSTQFKGQNIGRDRSTSERELAIIKMLKDGSNLTIRDFFLVIKGCSEKTIQRELLRLVKLGVLKKSGERRWSRYSLSSPIS